MTQSGSKEIQLSFSTLTLHIHCGSSDNARAILAKLETSKEAAGEALETIESETAGAESEEEAAPEPKAVRWAPEPSAASPASAVVSPISSAAQRNGSGGEAATVLYDFDAQGEDELTVKENDSVSIVDRSDDEWWLVRNSRGQEGVVPAQYVQLGGDSSSAGAGGDNGYDAEEQRRHDEEEAAASAALEAERQREKEQKAEQRRAIERAAKEKMAQEEEDRQLALDLEKREVEKQIRREQRREMEALQKREDEHKAR